MVERATCAHRGYFGLRLIVFILNILPPSVRRQLINVFSLIGLKTHSSQLGYTVLADGLLFNWCGLGHRVTCRLPACFSAASNSSDATR